MRITLSLAKQNPVSVHHINIDGSGLLISYPDDLTHFLECDLSGSPNWKFTRLKDLSSQFLEDTKRHALYEQCNAVWE